MSISFILTSYNVAPYLQQSLQSLAAVARDGDQIIMVDDGSSDGSDAIIRDCAADPAFAPGVEMVPVCLGTNTMGGVGIAANIGLSLATRDTVFFVDGDDWIEPAGFNRARAQVTLWPADILIVNYLVFDDAAQRSYPPADADRWRRMSRTDDVQANRTQALGLIAVPWRKFYDRRFIERHALRFPEVDAFYEDNPFHWAVCLAAESIRFLDAVVCQHRVNRPGQTMGESGVALTAFFTHYRAIEKLLGPRDDGYRLIAVDWLLGNMAWHCDRLAPEAFYPYATEAAETLATIPGGLWSRAFEASQHRHPVWMVADRLRRGDVSGQIASWETAALHRRMDKVEAQLREVGGLSQSALDRLRGQDAAACFKALHGLANK